MKKCLDSYFFFLSGEHFSTFVWFFSDSVLLKEDYRVFIFCYCFYWSIKWFISYTPEYSSIKAFRAAILCQQTSVVKRKSRDQKLLRNIISRGFWIDFDDKQIRSFDIWFLSWSYIIISRYNIYFALAR